MLLVWILIGITVGFSYQAFNKPGLFERMSFNISAVVGNREYQRIFTSAFVHLDWMHLLFNMLVLFFFGEAAVLLFGLVGFFVIYFGANGIGKLLTLYLHRNNWAYTSAGASAAINGIIFALVVAAPSMGIGILFLPISIPAWLFGLLYVAFSIYGFKKSNDNINHAAHLGGALGGVLIATFMNPELLYENWWVVLLVLVPVGGFLALAAFRPEFLLIDKQFSSRIREKRSDMRRKSQLNQTEELNILLEKVNQSGLKSLSPHERKRLEDLSRNL